MIGIIPAAGLGTRMLGVTGGLAKELLPLGDATVLDRIIQEAHHAGCQPVCVVSSPAKEALTSHVHRLPGVDVVIQTHARGLGHAVMCVDRPGDAVVLLGDVAYQGGSPADRIGQLLYRGIDGCVAVEQVSEAEMAKYGIVEIDDLTGGIIRILEKPRPDETESRWAVASRYGLSERVRAYFEAYVADRNQTTAELTLTELLNAAITFGFDFKAVALRPEQRRVDCGDPATYALAQELPWN